MNTQTPTQPVQTKTYKSVQEKKRAFIAELRELLSKYNAEISAEENCVDVYLRVFDCENNLGHTWSGILDITYKLGDSNE